MKTGGTFHIQRVLGFTYRQRVLQKEKRVDT